VTRKDLKPGAQIAQACHAAIAFCMEHSELQQLWYQISNYIAILAASDESDLYKLIDRAERKGVRFSIFREPDLDNHITAIAIEPGDNGRRICSSFPLALKELGYNG
jgi:peptidyl-tRNA hydrolase